MAMQTAWDELKEHYPEGYIFETVDIDANPDTRAQFFIRMIPTLVMIKDGKEIARRASGGSLEELKEWIDSEQRNIQ